MSNYTPGPWSVVEREILEDKSVYPRHIIGGVTELQVCFLEGSSSARAFVYDETWKHLGQSEMSAANARLISSAPDLLKYLQWAVDNPSDDSYWIEQARAAIAKATGENNDPNN